MASEDEQREAVFETDADENTGDTEADSVQDNNSQNTAEINDDALKDGGQLDDGTPTSDGTDSQENQKPAEETGPGTDSQEKEKEKEQPSPEERIKQLEETVTTLTKENTTLKSLMQLQTSLVQANVTALQAYQNNVQIFLGTAGLGNIGFMAIPTGTGPPVAPPPPPPPPPSRSVSMPSMSKNNHGNNRPTKGGINPDEIVKMRAEIMEGRHRPVLRQLCDNCGRTENNRENGEKKGAEFMDKTFRSRAKSIAW